MNRDILSTVKLIISQEIGIEVESITPESRLAEDLGADSLDRIEIYMSCEEEFGVEILEEVAKQWRTVADIVETIRKDQ